MSLTSPSLHPMAAATGGDRSTAAVGSTGLNSSEADNRANGARTRATEDSEELPD
jgi:hypothetical protein